ncbi:MAG: DAK2 domain-containing protein, partial [Spirochaetota bacterium]
MSDAAIGYVDGSRLRLALLAGGARLMRYREQLNQINVFPVADSDTGTNMAGTLTAVVRRLTARRERSLAVVSRMAAEAAIQGARGNSGAILAP